MSGGLNSIDAVKKKIKVLQEQAEEAEERAEKLQSEVDKEKRSREEVHTPVERGAQRGEPGRAQDRLTTALQKLDEVEKSADESER
uniref:Uncharacterized protein n=1 Tax=Labrus bergylta TaxID=56723 RepID=A0A3Q3G605_9LABR